MYSQKTPYFKYMLIKWLPPWSGKSGEQPKERINKEYDTISSISFAIALQF